MCVCLGMCVCMAGSLLVNFWEIYSIEYKFALLFFARHVEEGEESGEVRGR